MKYGKLVDGHLVPAPNPLLGPIFKHYNPTEEVYRKFGYLPVVETAPPEEGYYEPSWAEQEGKIVQVWTEAEPPVVAEPEPQEPTPAPELTAAQQRELAYNTAHVIEWDGNMLTVTQAAQQWAYYAAEGAEDKTAALTALIAKAKADIRTQWPEEGG
ncbi:MAG: hypothetical protein IJE22_01645 [Oscillibacter sp.]|nr:hypothetical protein [Oscillibacter sp.]